MAISYNNLWKTLIDKGINKSELCKKVKISTSTMAKMTNGDIKITFHISKNVNESINIHKVNVVHN